MKLCNFAYRPPRMILVEIDRGHYPEQNYISLNFLWLIVFALGGVKVEKIKIIFIEFKGDFDKWGINSYVKWVQESIGDEKINIS
jgi:hypothetical protein